jgi:hypothetical protein
MAYDGILKLWMPRERIVLHNAKGSPIGDRLLEDDDEMPWIHN